jgi:hypothetical protein
LIRQVGLTGQARAVQPCAVDSICAYVSDWSRQIRRTKEVELHQGRNDVQDLHRQADQQQNGHFTRDPAEIPQPALGLIPQQLRQHDMSIAPQPTFKP